MAEELEERIKRLEELVAKLVTVTGEAEDAYYARLRKVYSEDVIPDEKLALMRRKWYTRGKPYADAVAKAKEIYRDWEKRHKRVDPSIKLRVWFAVLKAVLGITLRYDEEDILRRAGLYDEVMAIIRGRPTGGRR